MPRSVEPSPHRKFAAAITVYSAGAHIWGMVVAKPFELHLPTLLVHITGNSSELLSACHLVSVLLYSTSDHQHWHSAVYLLTFSYPLLVWAS